MRSAASPCSGSSTAWIILTGSPETMKSAGIAALVLTGLVAATNVARPGARRLPKSRPRAQLLAVPDEDVSQSRVLRRYAPAHGALDRRRDVRHQAGPRRRLPLRARRDGDVEHGAAGEAQPPARFPRRHGPRREPRASRGDRRIQPRAPPSPWGKMVHDYVKQGQGAKAYDAWMKGALTGKDPLQDLPGFARTMAEGDRGRREIQRARPLHRPHRLRVVQHPVRQQSPQERDLPRRQGQG